MRGADYQQSSIFSCISASQRAAKDRPARAIRVMANVALGELGPKFDAMYASQGRRSIAPEKLLRALLLQVLYAVRSERLLMKQRDYNFPLRWFSGLSIHAPVWDPTTFSKSRERRSNLTDHSATECRLRVKSTQAQTDRRYLRLAQDRGGTAQDVPPPRGAGPRL